MITPETTDIHADDTCGHIADAEGYYPCEYGCVCEDRRVAAGLSEYAGLLTAAADRIEAERSTGWISPPLPVGETTDVESALAAVVYADQEPGWRVRRHLARVNDWFDGEESEERERQIGVALDYLCEHGTDVGLEVVWLGRLMPVWRQPRPQVVRAVRVTAAILTEQAADIMRAHEVGA